MIHSFTWQINASRATQPYGRKKKRRKKIIIKNKTKTKKTKLFLNQTLLIFVLYMRQTWNTYLLLAISLWWSYLHLFEWILFLVCMALQFMDSYGTYGSYFHYGPTRDYYEWKQRVVKLNVLFEMFFFKISLSYQRMNEVVVYTLFVQVPRKLTWGSMLLFFDNQPESKCPYFALYLKSDFFPLLNVCAIKWLLM